MAQSTYDTAAAGNAQSASPKSLIESDRVEGTAVFAADNSHIGTIKRLMIDKTSGQVAYAVMSFGGFLGMGEDAYTVPWSKLAYDTDLGGYKTDLSPELVKGAPPEDNSGETGWSREHEARLHQYYGVSPYWGL